jgi:hypothetical protein
MRINIHRIIVQTKATQILYGFVGCVYGASKVIEYYPEKVYNILKEEYNLSLQDAKNNKIEKYKKEIEDYKKIVENSNDELDKMKNYSLLGKIFSLGEAFLLAFENTITTNKINEKNDLINMIENKEYFEVTQIKKPLFLIETNNLSTNIALSSIFYGTIFTLAGTIPIISFAIISSYGIYHNLHKK